MAQKAKKEEAMGFPGGIGRWMPVCERARAPPPWRAGKGLGKEQGRGRTPAHTLSSAWAHY